MKHFRPEAIKRLSRKLRRERRRLARRFGKGYWCAEHLIDWDYCMGPDDECVKERWPW